MNEKDTMINWLAKQDKELLSLAFMYAHNQYTFGVNVTEKWQTAVQQHDALQKAYIKGQYDVMRRVEAQRKTGKWISLDDFRGKYNEKGYKCSECGEYSDYEENFCPNCGTKMNSKKVTLWIN